LHLASEAVSRLCCVVLANVSGYDGSTGAGYMGRVEWRLLGYLKIYVSVECLVFGHGHCEERMAMFFIDAVL
jgi:hypothetical protein